MSKYEVISDQYSPVFGPEITSYLDTFHAVCNMTTLLLITFNRLPVLFTTEPLTLYSFYSIFQSLIWKLDLFLVLPRLLNISQCLYPFFFINFLVGRKTLFFLIISFHLRRILIVKVSSSCCFFVISVQLSSFFVWCCKILFNFVSVVKSRRYWWWHSFIYLFIFSFSNDSALIL